MNSSTLDSPVETQHPSEERTMAVLAHGSALLNLIGGVGGLIAAFVLWLTQREKSAWVGFHALQSLIYQAAVIVTTVLLVVVVWVVGFIVSFATVGFGTIVAVPVMILVFLGGFLLIAAGMIYSLYGAYQIYQGREFRYKWIGDWLENRSAGN
jgi:uncharacterized Tic20 family protein